ncbi:MAG: S8 family serine peptidase, partial [Acidobacteriota bacterium]
MSSQGESKMRHKASAPRSLAWITALGVCAVLLASFAQASDDETASQTAASAAARAEIAEDLHQILAQAADGEAVPVVIQYREGVTAAGRHAGQPGTRVVPSLDSVLARLDARQVESLAHDASVLSISPDRVVRANLDVAHADANADMAFARYGQTGRGITVALIDTGLAADVSVPEERVVARVDFVDGESEEATDGHGHGTHLAAIIGGEQGMAPEVSFAVLRVLDE